MGTKFYYSSLTKEAQECVFQILRKNDRTLLFYRLYNHVKEIEDNVIIRGETEKIIGVSRPGEKYIFYVVADVDGLSIKFRSQSRIPFVSNDTPRLVDLARNETEQAKSDPELFTIKRKPGEGSDSADINGNSIGTIQIDDEPFFSKFQLNPEEYHDVILKKHEFSTRAYNCLMRSKINTVEDLLKQSERSLSKIRNLGKTTRIEIVDWISLFASDGGKIVETTTSEREESDGSSFAEREIGGQLTDSEICSKIRMETYAWLNLAELAIQSECVSFEDCEDFCRQLKEWGTRLISSISNIPDRNREIARQRLVLNWSLNKIGDEIGLSRERVRQVCIKVKQRIDLRVFRYPEESVIDSLRQLKSVMMTPDESEILVCLKHAYNNNKDLCDIAFSILIPKDERRDFLEKMLGAPGPYYERPQALKEESTKSQTSVLPKEPDIQTGRYCPRCGSELLIRLARRGPNAGNQFVGCSAFPQCRYAESLSLREAYALGIAIPNKSGD